ncbi:MAG: 4Fe-4S dicluster domain-containing protein [Desulfitobacteriia bacterium]
MSARITRRTFFKRSAAAGVLSFLAASGLNKPLYGLTDSQEVGTVIDLTKCDGCHSLDTPLCVSSCRQKNEANFPEPVQPIKPYWPQDKFEDWSKERELTNRLTPYNWSFVEHVQVEENGKLEDVYILRRCMHCDNPTCQKLCPFSAISKDERGAVAINDQICLGGAKCRDVCPWGIPQRQAGVGLYLNIAPTLAGGGVMYKCDNCRDLLAQGEKPRCETACPKGAILTGPKEEMKNYARKRAEEIGGYIYGDTQNGGTSTFYISKVSFAKISKAIAEAKQAKGDKRPGRPLLPEKVENYLETEKGMAIGALTAPVAGAALAAFTAYKTMKGEKADE